MIEKGPFLPRRPKAGRLALFLLHVAILIGVAIPVFGH